MSRVTSYRDLRVWTAAVDLAEHVCKLTRGFPNNEMYGLAIQACRSAVSVPSNIAEGQARHTTKEFIQFLSHAEGSLAELDTQIIVSMELGLCAPGSAARSQDLGGELKRMLNALRRKLEEKSS